MMRPALTGATQYSTEPLPLPMRTSAGFLLTGTSGKMRIHTRPGALEVAGDRAPRRLDLARA